ncbi:MAG: hypothetical protein GAK28_04563 [Luteibacter sp.]|uniref:hypothetical protein n=1 Tax=Luteibacter sp. TaxID=1886636 RepID=UPI001381BD96|nr:hypothetical protein [Luteibacter sp.]KAF1003682.1 MAG: hypothetical protein GAK28_04563 [Luteibacter sp.]
MFGTSEDDKVFRHLGQGHYVKLWCVRGMHVIGMVDRVDWACRQLVFDHPQPLPSRGMNDGTTTLVPFDHVTAIRHYVSASVAAHEIHLETLRVGHPVVIGFPYRDGRRPGKQPGVLHHVDWSRRELVLHGGGESRIIAFDSVASIGRRSGHVVSGDGAPLARQTPDWVRRYGGGWSSGSA